MACVSASTSLRDSLLLASYSAEVMACKSKEIVVSFRVSRLWPSSQAIMLQRSKENVTMAPEGDSKREAAQRAAPAVISEAMQRIM